MRIVPACRLIIPGAGPLITSRASVMSLRCRQPLHPVFSPVAAAALLCPALQEVIEFLFFPVVNEGCRVLAEGIVDKPADLDVATVMAMGFPPYR